MTHRSSNLKNIYAPTKAQHHADTIRARNIVDWAIGVAKAARNPKVFINFAHTAEFHAYNRAAERVYSKKNKTMHAACAARKAEVAS